MMQTETLTSDGISADTFCPNCTVNTAKFDVFCQQCGYPVNGTEDEQKEFKLNITRKQVELSTLQDKINGARNTLLVLAGLCTLFGLFSYGRGAEDAAAILVVALILAAIYLGLAFWTVKQPVAGLISGLVLFIIVQILGAIEDPTNLARGIIIKIFVLMYLFKGLKSAFDARKIQSELDI